VHSRLGEDPAEPDSVFAKINEVFEYMPLAAVIEDKIVCLHGGIGSTLVTIDQIESIPRPLEVIHEVSTPEH
jgi:protein phosphatase